MKVLTHEIKLEIKQKFREEMEGKIDTSWRNQYADYFVPRSAALHSNSAVTKTTFDEGAESVQIPAQVVLRSSSFGSTLFEEPGLIEAAHSMTLKEFERQVFGAGKCDWTKIPAKYRALGCFIALLVIGGFVCSFLIPSLEIRD